MECVGCQSRKKTYCTLKLISHKLKQAKFDNVNLYVSYDTYPELLDCVRINHNLCIYL